ncbi:hypothetical protein SLA2020_311990 [Shorea laevis]
MDENKSRTDLLAAGRKKLQQFRQKKDGKASSRQGKSSKKSSKSEQPEPDGDATSTVAKPTALSQAHVGEITALDDSSTSFSMENALLEDHEREITALDDSSASHSSENATCTLAKQTALSQDQEGEIAALDDSSAQVQEGEIIVLDDSSASRSMENALSRVHEGEITVLNDSSASHSSENATSTVAKLTALSQVHEGDITALDDLSASCSLENAASTMAKQTALTQVQEGEIAPLDDSLASQSMENVLSQIQEGEIVALDDSSALRSMENALSRVQEREFAALDDSSALHSKENALSQVHEGETAALDDSSALRSMENALSQQVHEGEIAALDDSSASCSSENAASTVAKQTALSQDQEGEIAALDDSSASHTTENALSQVQEGEIAVLDDSSMSHSMENTLLQVYEGEITALDDSSTSFSSEKATFTVAKPTALSLLHEGEITALDDSSASCLLENAASTVAKQTALSQDQEGEINALDDSSALHSTENASSQVQEGEIVALDDSSAPHSMENPLSQVQGGEIAVLDDSSAPHSLENATTTVAKPTALPQVHEGEITADDDSSASRSLENSLFSEHDVAAVDPPLEPIMDQLESLSGQRLELQSVKDQLDLELMSRTNYVEELSTQCLDLNAIKKLIEDVEVVVKLEDCGTDSDRTPGSHLESLVSLLVHKYKEISGELGHLREEFDSKVTESAELQEKNQKIHQLDELKIQHENEIVTLKKSLSQANEALETAFRTAELQEKNQIRQLDALELQHEIEILTLKESLSQANESFEIAFRAAELREKNQKIHQLDALKLQHQIEIVTLKESLSQAHEALEIAFRTAELQEKNQKIHQLDALELQHDIEILTLKESLSQANEALEIAFRTAELQERYQKTHQLDAVKLQHEIEILTLKESLSQANEALEIASSKLQRKINELEQSEQRVSSIREKLSIAVAKGKGLIVQRDSLKQSLAETSSELERCSQELQLKDARVEALESELSYIRNSATAIRESFLLKDSVLQRIEEILEDLDLPEHFHSRDIIEKVDWLARSAAGNSLPPTDWDQKSSMGASYSDAGFVAVDAWKDDVHPSSNSGEELRRQYEELQSKFYGLAEQNEMLEQSLMERNHLVQRWEELLNRIHMPSHLQSMEPENRIEWLRSALLEANHERDSLQRKIDNVEDCCGSLTADLAESQKKISDLQADLQSVVHDREHLFERLQALISDHNELLAKVVHVEQENERLQVEITGLRDKLAEKLEGEEHLLSIEGTISRLEGLVRDALQDPGMSDLVSGSSSLESFEGLLKKLIEKYSSLKSSVNPLLHDAVDKHHEESDAASDDARSRGTLPTEETDVASLKKQLEEALQDLIHMREERDRYLEREQSLLSDVQAINKKREELQELLNQEEQKSVSLREKLNIAVRKGKSLVQQQDALKQNVKNMNTELEHLKSEISHRENSLAEYEQKITELSCYPERAEALNSENFFLKSHLAETEHFLQEREHTLTSVLNTLADIDFDVVIDTSDPVEKLEKVAKLCNDLNLAVASSEQELRKSRRATELLLTELNEVQERNDGLQEELAKAARELAEFMRERDLAETAKLEALSHVEKLSMIHNEEKRKQYSDLLVLKSSLNQVRDGLTDIYNLVSDVFSSDLELLKDLEANIVSCVKWNDAGEVASLSFYNASGGITSSNLQNEESFWSVDSWSNANLPDHFDANFTVDAGGFVAHHLQEFMNEIIALKEKLNRHLKSLHEQASSLSSAMGVLHRERASEKESFEALRRDIVRLESIGGEKDMKIGALSRNIALLNEACANSIIEIENRKAELLGKNFSAADMGSLKSVTDTDLGLPFTRQTDISSEEYVKAMADRVSLAVKEFATVKADFAENALKEMKMSVANLQKELQEKDIQKDRICIELVAQIKEAESAAASYSQDLQSSKTLVHDLQKRVEHMQEDRDLLEQRVKELHDVQAISMELQNRVGSLTDKLSAKDQEIEALMQALDEEEVQMEELTRKIEGLEEILQKKNVDLENLEASRAKVVKKLAVTVSKFDELHNLSENLLSEIEKLQSQLQDRDAEISFLRNEVTRCTNDVLAVSQTNHKRDSEEIYELLTWFDAVVSRVEVPDLHVDDKNSNQVHEYKEVLQKRINSIISELEDLRVVAQSRDALLQAERSKVEELIRREETLQRTLHEKESQLNMLENVADSAQATGFNSEIVEVEPVVNKRAVAGTSTASQVRSLRKVNNDQVAIAIDMDPGGSNRLEDEDDDKVHGFKSLTTSRIIPKFTRPVTDMVDGLWVSCDRALMRQPALRLGIIMYWAVLHALLAAFVF